MSLEGVISKYFELQAKKDLSCVVPEQTNQCKLLFYRLRQCILSNKLRSNEVSTLPYKCDDIQREFFRVCTWSDINRSNSYILEEIISSYNRSINRDDFK